MKKILLLLLSIFILSCPKDNEDETGVHNSILLLRIDYITYQFEGGYEQSINGRIESSDTIPIAVNYKSPGDFGNISLYYQPTNDLLFDGSIIWMGTGTIKYPETFKSSDSYPLLDNPISRPDDSKFKCIFGVPPTDYSLIWNSISRLRIISDYLKSNKKISLFLYTPSVGVGNPNDWDWIIIMNRAN